MCSTRIRPCVSGAFSLALMCLSFTPCLVAQTPTGPASPNEVRLPAKVGRYVVRLIDAYDADRDGQLQREEWAGMSGSPQAIDLDADGAITLREMTYRVASYWLNYGKAPHEVKEEEERDASQGFQVFHPITATRQAASPQAEGASANGATADDDANDVDPAEVATDRLLQEGPIGQRKYHRPPADLAGCPAWFLMKDTDGDGQVSMIEFAPNLSSPLLAQFGAMDRNGDGILSPAESRGR